MAHACQACAKARVKCEEVKPCTRCRNRNLNCEYASTEAGSAAAMHLLHLSAHAHSTMGPQSSGLVAPMDPLSHNLASEVMSSPHNQSAPMNALSRATPTMTNPGYSQSTGNSPPIMASHPQGNNEAMQLPTPDTMVDQQSESPLSHRCPSSVTNGLVGADFYFILPSGSSHLMSHLISHPRVLWLPKGLASHIAACCLLSSSHIMTTRCLAVTVL